MQYDPAVQDTVITHATMPSARLEKSTETPSSATADIIIRFSRVDYSNYIECLKSSTGATFLPKIVKIKDTIPLLEIIG